jgi:hypothetical protein
MGWHTVGTMATSKKSSPKKIKKKTGCNKHVQAMAKNAFVVASKHPLFIQGHFFMSKVPILTYSS